MNSNQQKDLQMNSKTNQVFFSASSVLGKFHGTKEVQAFRSANKENIKTTHKSLSFSGNNKDANFASFHQMISFINKNNRSDTSGHISPTTKVKISNMVLNNDMSKELVVALKNLNVNHLEMKTCRITDITGLTTLTQLKTLNLHWNRIADITSLSALTQLETLDLSDNKITDITSLATLTQLKILDLAFNKITDITCLSTLTQLKTLFLHCNRIIDITGLTALTQLEYLDISLNEITDIIGLTTLIQLKELDVSSNKI